MKSLLLAGMTIPVIMLAFVFWFSTTVPALAQTQTIFTSIPLCEINRGLSVGSTGDDVRCLQRYLNYSGYTVASIGPGSPGNETVYFGQLTAQAVARWQNANRAYVLTPIGLSNGTSYWGNLSFSRYVSIARIALGI